MAGPVALLTKKGDKWHRLAGKVFSFSMLFVASIAIVIALLSDHHNFFLGVIGVFNISLTITGNRYLKLKN